MSDSTKKFLSLDGLSHLWAVLKTKFDKKVDKEFKTGSTSAYKVLSDNNLTDELVTKIQNAGDSTFSGNYNDLIGIPSEFTPSAHTHDEYITEHQDISHLASKSEIPTNNNQLTNGAGYQTSSDVQNAINNALSGITGIDFQVVTELPATGVKGVIYLLNNSGITPNIYDEYIWATDKFEKIGTTDVDLSGYLKTSDVVSITNEEIDTICV